MNGVSIIRTFLVRVKTAPRPSLLLSAFYLWPSRRIVARLHHLHGARGSDFASPAAESHPSPRLRRTSSPPSRVRGQPRDAPGRDRVPAIRCSPSPAFSKPRTIRRLTACTTCAAREDPTSPAGRGIASFTTATSDKRRALPWPLSNLSGAVTALP